MPGGEFTRHTKEKKKKKKKGNKTMRCSSPNLIYFSDLDEDNKKRVHFVKVNSRSYSKEFYRKIVLSGAIEVPCGQCAACRLEYSRVWANRCYLESLCHEHNWFVTLTYNEENLVFGDKGMPTLEKDALSKFIRALRDKLGHDKCIRYFGCGEYGEKNLRPHYHLIIFGANISDLDINMPDMSKQPINGRYPIFRRTNSNGDYVMWSKTIYDCWKKGKIEIEDASWNCAAYVSRYVMKKQKGKGAVIYNHLGILPEFIRMSSKPGIGAKWLLDHKEDLLKYDYLSVKNAKGVQTSRPPRYFEKLMLKNPESLEAVLMDCNKLSRIVNSLKRCDESLTSKPLQAQLDDRSDFVKKKSLLLKRDYT